VTLFRVYFPPKRTVKKSRELDSCDSNLESIDWNLTVANPEALGDAEKKRWLEVEPVLTQVLDELWNGDKIETVFEIRDKTAFASCIRKVDEFSRVHNALIDPTRTRETASSFTNAIMKFGWDESMIVLDYILVAISLAVLKIELFKLVLLFHLKDLENRSIGNFSRTMKGVAPVSWKKLGPLVNSPLRNALAHGTYAIGPPRMVLYQDAKLEQAEEMVLGEFITNAKAQDVLLQCLIYLLRKRGFYALEKA